MPCACFSVYVYMCVRVCVCLLNVFLYKIGSSGSSTSRRTTLALRMKPDLQKYVAHVFRVFGTFSPLSCPPLPHSSPHLISLSLSLSTISTNPSFAHPRRYFLTPLLPHHSLVHAVHSLSLFLSRLPSPSQYSTLKNSLETVSGIEIHRTRSPSSRVRRGKDRRHLLAESSSLTPRRANNIVSRPCSSYHLWRQRSREGPVARRRENRQFG